MDNPENPQENSVPVAEGEKPAAPAKPRPAPPPRPAAPTAGAAPKGPTRTVEGKTTEGARTEAPNSVTRRRIVWACIWGYLAANFLMFLRFFLPRTIFEPSNTFKIGFPQDFAFGVDTKFQQQFRIWVVRNAERLFVIYARCTHLGCTPDWKASEAKFKCPCHGSGYDSEGVNFEGPAPRPMDRAHVEVSPDGQIVVDIGHLYQQPKGARTQFNDDGAFLRV